MAVTMGDKAERIAELEARLDAQALELERINKRLEQLEQGARVDSGRSRQEG
jgi:uncharacterized coiled-coil protein SlyX